MDDHDGPLPPAPLVRLYAKYQFRRGAKKKTRWIPTGFMKCLDERCALVLPIDGPRAGGLCWHKRPARKAPQL